MLDTAELTPIGEIWLRLKKNKAAMVALFVVLFIVLVALFADVIADYQTMAIQQHPEIRLQGPSAEHWFGTDAFGRDVFARVIHGARYSLLFGVVCTFLSTAAGCILAAFAAYLGKAVETVIMRAMDAMMSIPFILLVLVIIAAVGSGFKSMFIAMVIAYVPAFTRMIHSFVVTVVRQEYIEAARSSGAKRLTIIFTHVLPNAIGPIIVNVTMMVPQAIFTEAFLSFVGVGISAPLASWGTLAQDARTQIELFPLQILFPLLAICITIFALNFIGDGLGASLDPKNRKE